MSIAMSINTLCSVAKTVTSEVGNMSDFDCLEALRVENNYFRTRAKFSWANVSRSSRTRIRSRFHS